MSDDNMVRDALLSCEEKFLSSLETASHELLEIGAKAALSREHIYRLLVGAALRAVERFKEPKRWAE